MKKYYNSHGNEIKVGDTVTISSQGPFSMATLTVDVADENILKILVQHGVLEEKDVKASEKSLLKKEDIPMELEFYVNLLEKQTGLSNEEFSEAFGAMERVNPSIVFDMLLWTVARYLDEQYPDHIKDSERIFALDINGRVVEVDEEIKTFKTFPAFRSPEDAGIACRILRPLKKQLFKNGK